MSLLKSFFKSDTHLEFPFQDKPSQMYLIQQVVPHLHMPFALRRAKDNLLLVLQSGSIDIQISTKTYQVQGPCLIFISSGTIYALQDISADSQGFFTLLENRVLEAMMNLDTILNLSMIHPITTMDHHQSIWYESVCQLFYHEVTKEKPKRKIGYSFLQAMLLNLIDLAGLKAVIPRDEQVAVGFRVLLNQYISGQNSISFYADRLGISANYLNRCLKTVFNKTARELIIDTVILHSQLLLIETNMDISEVAYSLNFEDPSYFARVFKKVTGMSPRAFRCANMHN